MAGEFNQWNSKLCQLKKDPKTNIWSREVDILKPEDESISTIKFKFVINDSNWVTNYQLPKVKEKDGHENNIVGIPGRNH